MRKMYHLALHHGVMKPLITEYEKDFFLKNNVEYDSDEDSINQSLFFDSRTARRKEDSYDQFQPVDTWKEGYVVELARATLPSGYLNKIARIDTLLVDETTGQPVTGWNNPIGWDNNFRFALSFNGVNDQSIKSRLIRESTSTIPWFRRIASVPLAPFDSWTDDRYAWGNPSNNLDYFVPKEIILRLFIICEKDTDFRHIAKGRIVTTMQRENTANAEWAATRGNIR